MKKSILLAMVLSSLSIADAWNFKGNAVAYIQTQDNSGTTDFGSDESTFNDFGIQLKATNHSLFDTIGAGIELTGLYSNNKFSNLRIQHAGNSESGTPRESGGAITQAYLTYGYLNSSIKAGRQHLPKSLSPFAFTETWQPLENSFDALLLVNTDISNTAVIYAGVNKSNGSNSADIGSFNKINQNGTLVHMLTVQNKSIENFIVTGSFYYTADYKVDTTIDNLSILWGDAKYLYNNYTISVQAGQIQKMENTKETNAFGMQAGTTYNIYNASVSLSYVNDGTIKLQNLGTGVKTPLYTQLILNQGRIKSNSSTVVVRLGAKVLEGKLEIAYDFTKDYSEAKIDYTEFEVTFKKNLTQQTKIFLGYMYADLDAKNMDPNNRFRVWVKYNF